jgi:hypothetical protein
MRALSSSELLSVWERGWAQPPARQALTLLASAFPDLSADALARLSVGRRDALLLTLRERLFGPRLVGLAVCQNCGERLELTFGAGEIRAAPDDEPSETLSLDADGYRVEFRLPNSQDLVDVTDCHDEPSARQLLLDRCLLIASRNGEQTAPDQLPASLVEAVTKRMATADPQADVSLALICPHCRHEWQAAFDIVSFLWSEINAWAQRILCEVHTLASAYGWREADILALSPSRRQLYLELVGA